MSYNPEWIQEDKQRVIDLDRWYHIDGRHRKSHKMHGVYTGLKEIAPKLDRVYELVQRMSDAYDRLH
tara:strand:+ start:683 stop:883 length:201 start_codon:yes stop_codon:yes gene_type:complete